MVSLVSAMIDLPQYLFDLKIMRLWDAFSVDELEALQAALFDFDGWGVSLDQEKILKEMFDGLHHELAMRCPERWTDAGRIF